ncbi:transcription termination factor Rho [Candidatus Vidania fulgoroideae]|uniref:Transcription termination factor Rho n=1 Tax=Candidatus Vidania fulgoroideorum TaxID=881286 RepID=A0AAX3NA92_9PROT|nr:transcription termination factor Rho [Candidatus Vidania fulgoroideae]WDR79334.1 transcription termination factor Rho [Candidatus Vidania fulgoroideae]
MKNFKGILEIIKNFGYIRQKNKKYISCKNDIIVRNNIIRTYKLKNGDFIKFNFCDKKIEILEINKKKKIFKRNEFINLIPIHPKEQIFLSNNNSVISNRIIDIFSPIGKGQRGLIVAPPKSGKTIILKNIGKSIKINYPKIKLIILLIDERPEEVTEIKNSLNCETYYSNFDESPYRHIQISELVLERAKRLVEMKRDVVLLLDSITRLARAYNIVTPNSGRTLSGGIDINALIRPKRFFGAARNTKIGSLTILGTVLIKTGSKMDELIYEEFKGTGNMEIYLNENIVYEKVFPAIDIKKSGTRREELILKKDIYKKVRKLRIFLSKLNSLDSIKFLINKMKKTLSNKEFFNTIKI